MHYQIEWYVVDRVVPWSERGEPAKAPAYVKCGGWLWIESDSEENAIKRFITVTNRSSTRCTVLATEDRTIKTIQTNGNKNKTRTPALGQGIEKDPLVLSGPTNT